LVILSDTKNKVIAREAVELHGDLKNGPVIGSGAWIFRDWTPQTNIRFQRNPDYYAKDEFGNQLPYADEFEMPRILDPSLLIAGFRTRQIPVASPANHRQAQDLQNSLKDTQIAPLPKLPDGGTIELIIHADQAPTNDIRVRQAISKVID